MLRAYRQTGVCVDITSFPMEPLMDILQLWIGHMGIYLGRTQIRMPQ